MRKIVIIILLFIYPIKEYYTCIKTNYNLSIIIEIMFSYSILLLFFYLQYRIVEHKAPLSNIKKILIIIVSFFLTTFPFYIYNYFFSFECDIYPLYSLNIITIYVLYIIKE